MAGFAAKYLVDSATSGMRSTIGGQLGQEEQLTEEEFEKIEKHLEKEDDERQRKHAHFEQKRLKERERIRMKYGIEKSKRHEPTETHSALLIRKTSKSNEKELLIQAEDEEDDECCPCCNLRTCFPCLVKFFPKKHS